MVPLHRARNDARRLATASVLIGVALALIIPAEESWGSPTEIDAQQRIFLPAAPAEAFSGEIEYEFDTLRNVTRAQFQASLDAHGILGRMFLAAPTVHTIIATYQFAGRSVTRVPDSIRISLLSDEYVEQTREEHNALPPATRPLLELNMAHIHASYGIAFAQRMVSKSGDSIFPETLHLPDRPMRVQMLQTRQVQITRTATSFLSICEFLELISEEDVKGTVAGLDFALSHRVIAGLREFASQMKSNEVGAASVSCAAPLVRN